MTELRRVPVTGKKERSGRGELPQPAPSAPEEPAACDCPRLEAADWDGVESDWSDIAFLRGSVTAVLGVPVSYAGTREALLQKARELGAEVPEEPMFLLGGGRFRRPVYLEVENVAAAARGVVRPGGIAFSRIVQAPWGEMKRVVDESRDAARAKYGRNPDDILLWYITCRECSRERNFETLVIAHYRNAP